MDHDKSLRQHLLKLLEGGQAHATFEQAVADLAPEKRGERVKGFPKTAWMLLEHLRIAQWDILEFSRDPKHQSPTWPDGYWAQDAPPTDTAWDESVRAFQKDARTMQRLVKEPRTDLYTPLPWGTGQTILRQALLVADHNAYHIGQLITLRRLLGAWQDK